MDDKFLNILCDKINSQEIEDMANGIFESNLKQFDSELELIIENDANREKLLQLVECQNVFNFEQLFNIEEFIEKRFQFVASGSFGNAMILHVGRRRMQKIIKAIRCLPEKLALNFSTGAMSYGDVYKELICLKILSKLCPGVRLTSQNVILEESVDYGDEFCGKNMNIEHSTANTSTDDSYGDENIQTIFPSRRRNKSFRFKTNCFPKMYKAYLCRNETKALFNFESTMYSFNGYRIPTHENLETMIILMEHCGTQLNELIASKQISPTSIISVFKQIVIGLAIAESIFNFEHRDLHLSNITCIKTKSRWIKFVYKSQKYRILSLDYEAKIIDFTYSRISYNEKIYYKDLTYLNSGEENMSASPIDDPYKEMASLFEPNHWCNYSSRSNIVWLKYLLKDLLYQIQEHYKSQSFYQKTMITIEYLQSLQKVLNECSDIFHLFNQLISDDFNKLAPFRCY